MSHRMCFGAVALGSLLLMGACSDDGGNTTPDAARADQGIVDKGTSPDLSLWACDNPGGSCNAHNPCAINPICGQDKLCRPESMQNCDDGLDCTDDICKGLGQCENRPKAGLCALRVVAAQGTEIRCFAKDDLKPDDPCQICDPETDSLKWSPRNGGACDDGDLCTKDDYCQSGTCKGTDYRADCSDKLSCTDDGCDGKGGCGTPKLDANACLIGGACYADQQKDTTGCNVCDVKTSQSDWTAVQAHCLIGSKCYLPGEQDSTKCSECDPTKNDKDWSPLPGLCKIGSVCYKAGDKHSGGCAECDPTANASGWTVKTTGDCLIDNVCKKLDDLDTTACAKCDPAADKYAWTPLTGKCKIDNKCYNSGDAYPAGCAECDPAINATAWTVKTTQCLIGGVCLQPGALDSIGCGSCDPATDKYAWTPVSGKCKIGGACYADQQKDSTGCLVCNVATSPTAWSPVAGVTTASYNFDAGTSFPAGWSQSSTVSTVKWQVASGKRSISGNNAIWYGDPATGTYEDPGFLGNAGTLTLTGIVVPAGKKAGMTFNVWMDIETYSFADLLEVRVKGSTTTLWSKPTTSADQKKWIEVTVDLSAQAGKTIDIEFFFDTTDDYINDGEGIYIDDVTVYTGC